MNRNELPKVCLGAWAWGNDGTFGGTLTKEMLEPVFLKGQELGLNLWDNAYVYGMGESERTLGEFFKKLDRNEFMISAKFTPQCASMFGSDPVRGMLNASAELLNVGYMDFYWIHNPVGHPHYIKYLIPLLKEGKIKHVGVSNHSLKEIKEADAILNEYGYKIEGVQNHYSLLNRSSESSGIIDYCNQNGIVFFSYMVLEQGALTGVFNKNHPFPADSDRGSKYNPVLDKLEVLNNALKEIGDRHGISISQTAIAYAINKGTLPIVGATKVKHVIEAKEACDVILSKEEINRLEEVASGLHLSTVREWEKEMK